MSESIQDKYYYSDGSILDYYDCRKELHRENGPAVEYAPNLGYDGNMDYSRSRKEWWIDGKRHRLDGPAVECYESIQYYIHYQYLTKDEFEAHPLRQQYLFDLEVEKVLNRSNL